MEDQDILNELLERIKNMEKRNDNLKIEIQNKKVELMKFDNNAMEEEKDNNNNKNIINEEKEKKSKEENDKKKEKMPTEEEDKKLGERALYDLKTIKHNSENIDNTVSEITIQYITQEQYSNLYIMGDFTKWEPISMKKSKDIFSYKVILLKGFKYYYSFQAGDQIIINFNSEYESNPRTLQPQNFVDLSDKGKEPQIFDFQNDMNILEIAQKNYFLSKLEINEEEFLFLDKFKRHINISKKLGKEKMDKFNILSDSIYSYYDYKFRFIRPYEVTSKLMNLKIFFEGRILAHYYYYDQKEKPWFFYYKIMSIADNYSFQCIKMYDNNKIKINMKYYNDYHYYYSIKFEQISLAPITEKSKDYHLLPPEESRKVLTDYDKDTDGILKAHFKTLIGLRNQPINNPVPSNMMMNLDIAYRSLFNYTRSYGSIIVIPDRVEPDRINVNDYEFSYSLNRVNKVKNKREGSFVEFQAIDETVEKAKIPFGLKIFYSIKNKKIKIIHYHILDKDLRDKKINIQEIDSKADPITFAKNEEHIKSNELLLLVMDSYPFKLYYQGNEVKMDAFCVEENKLYLLSSPNSDSYFNGMYVTVNSIEDKLKYDIVEQCSEFSKNDIINGVDVVVSYDNIKNLVTEPMMLAVSPCLLKKIPIDQEMELKKLKFVSELKGKNDLEKYFFINEKINDLRKYSKEDINKMEAKEKEKIMANLNEYKLAMPSIMKYIENNEMWDQLDMATILSSDIENIIKLFKINKS